jgi:sec-independent protein translocase protein TatA
MRIGPFGVWEILIILIVILLIFGPRRLPDMAKGLGQSVRAFRKEMRGLKDDIDGQPTADGAPATATASEAASASGPTTPGPHPPAPTSDAPVREDGGERVSS